MPNTRDIRRRIKSVKNTSQITKAMQMVAAAKMRKAQQSAINGKPYAAKIYNLLMHVKRSVDPSLHPLLKEPGAGKHLVLVVSPDKGLCGALNTNLFREAARIAAEGETYFVSSGRRASQYLARTRREVLADFPVGDPPQFAETKRIAKFCVDQFLDGNVARFSILYTSFVNTLVQQPKLVQVLPVKSLESVLGEAFSGEPDSGVVSAGYKFEPDAQSVLQALVPFAINSCMYQFFLSARAAEHSARMVAMKNATENAKNLIKDLTLEYNKLRQAGITNELLEISTAQMALQ